VNIALANELALICDRMGISVWEVIEAASTKPYGFMAFYPGPGLGATAYPLILSIFLGKLKNTITTQR